MIGSSTASGSADYDEFFLQGFSPRLRAICESDKTAAIACRKLDVASAITIARGWDSDAELINDLTTHGMQLIDAEALRKACIKQAESIAQRNERVDNQQHRP